MSLPIFKKAVVITFIIGGLAGLFAALAAEEMDRLTTTDEFCTSCHAMQTNIADAEVYKTSLHQTTASGVRAGCGDCHFASDFVAFRRELLLPRAAPPEYGNSALHAEESSPPKSGHRTNSHLGP